MASRHGQRLLVLQISESGAHSVRELTRGDLLTAARKAAREASPALEHGTGVVNARGRTPRRAVSSRLDGAVQPRDVRMFDPAFSNSHDPEIVTRRHAVLVHLDPVKALVLHSECYIIVPDGADSLLGTMLLRLRELEREEVNTAFEMRMYEAILTAVAALLEDEFHELRPRVKDSIHSVLKTTSGVVLETLRTKDAELSQLERRVNANRHALTEIMSSDQDMAFMSLTKQHEWPELFSIEIADHLENEHEEVELLLETYLQMLDGIYAGLRDLRDDLTAARASTTLRLSQAQNKLLSVDLLVSSVTAVSSLGALVAGVFGMNLNSGKENRVNLFWIVFGVVVGVAPVLTGSFLAYIRSRGLVIT